MPGAMQGSPGQWEDAPAPGDRPMSGDGPWVCDPGPLSTVGLVEFSTTSGSPLSLRAFSLKFFSWRSLGLPSSVERVVGVYRPLEPRSLALGVGYLLWGQTCGPFKVGPFKVGPFEDDLFEVGSSEVGLSEVGIVEVGIVEVGLLEVGPSEVGLLEVGPIEVGLLEVGLLEVGPSEVGPAEVGPAEVGPAEVGLREVGHCEVGPSEVGPREVGLIEVGLLEVGPFEVDPHEVGPWEVGIFEVKPRQISVFSGDALKAKNMPEPLTIGRDRFLVMLFPSSGSVLSCSSGFSLPSSASSGSTGHYGLQGFL